MSDLLEHDLREAFVEQAARVSPETSARLRAIDYRPHLRRWPSRPVLGGLGVSGAAAVAGAAILLGSSAAPAFAGWTTRPTTPRPGELAAAEQQCDRDGTPVLTDTRGPYTASIYADGATCLEGNGITISSRTAGGPSSVPAGKIQLNGTSESDSNGNSLTMVDGQIGAGVTSVTITRSDGSSIQASVQNGWYLAWWPGSEHPVTAQVATASGTDTQMFPPAPSGYGTPPCPAGAHCSSGYGFGSAAGKGSERTTSVSVPGSTTAGP